MGSVRGHVCETRRDLCGVFCSQNARCRLRRAEHVCSRGEPLGSRGLFFFFNARVTSWLPARVVRVRQEGVIPCRMVPSKWDEVHVQLHDVTGKVQPARLIIAAQRREDSCRAKVHDVRVAALDAHFKFKIRINSEQNRSTPRFRVNMISQGRGEIPPVLWAQDIQLVRGTG